MSPEDEAKLNALGFVQSLLVDPIPGQWQRNDRQQLAVKQRERANTDSLN